MAVSEVATEQRRLSQGMIQRAKTTKKTSMPEKPLTRSRSIKGTLSSLLGSSSSPISSRKNSSTSLSSGRDSPRRVTSQESPLRKRSSIYGSLKSLEPRRSQSHSVIKNSNEPQSPKIEKRRSSDITLHRNSSASALPSHSQFRQPTVGTVKEEKPTVIQELNLLKKEILSNYLNSRGFINTKEMYTNDKFTISVATGSNTVFLPTTSTHTDEYLARLYGLRNDATPDQPPINATNSNETSTSHHQENTNNNSISPTTNEGNNRLPQQMHTRRDVQDESIQNLERLNGNVSSYNVAVIVKVDKPTYFHDIEVKLISRLRVFWNKGVPPTKSFKEEIYHGGSLDWTLNARNYDLFIPSKISSSDKIIENKRHPRALKLFKNSLPTERVYIDPTQHKSQLVNQSNSSKLRELHSGFYVFIIPIVFSGKIPESMYFPSARVAYRLCIATKLDSSSSMGFEDPAKSFRAVPALRNKSSQESLNSINSMDSGKGKRRNSLFMKVKNSFHIAPEETKQKYDGRNDVYVEHPINIVRTPPLASFSTVDNSILINKVWSDALAYEILVGQKFISLNSKIPIQVKMTPLDANLRVERVRVNVIERISFANKNFEYEYDQVDVIAQDPSNPYYADFQSKRRKDRSLTLLEVRGKEKGNRALKEEIITNCFEGNILAYETLSHGPGALAIGINEPLTLKSSLEFPKYVMPGAKDSNFTPPYGVDHYSAVPNPENKPVVKETHHNGVLSFFSDHSGPSSPSTPSTTADDIPVNPKFHETEIESASKIKAQYYTRLHEAKRGLYFDSLNCSTISSKHLLEVVFRVSKKDVIDPKKVKNYEVVIDIPIFIHSELCEKSNMQLPSYDNALKDSKSKKGFVYKSLPSFEEVTRLSNSSPDLLSDVRRLNTSRVSSFGNKSVMSSSTTSTTKIKDLSPKKELFKKDYSIAFKESELKKKKPVLYEVEGPDLKRHLTKSEPPNYEESKESLRKEASKLN